MKTSFDIMSKPVVLLITFAVGFWLIQCGSPKNSNIQRGSLSLQMRIADSNDNNPMLRIDCAASSLNLLELELFNENGETVKEEGPWDCSQHSGSITGIPAGDAYTLYVYGYSWEMQDKILAYIGSKTDIAIKSDQDTQCEIDLAPANNVPILSGRSVHVGDEPKIYGDFSEAQYPEGLTVVLPFTLDSNPLRATLVVWTYDINLERSAEIKINGHHFSFLKKGTSWQEQAFQVQPSSYELKMGPNTLTIVSSENPGQAHEDFLVKNIYLRH